jgi:hypothetical protein
VQQLRLEVPERAVERRNGRGGKSRAPQVAHALLHAQPQRAGVARVRMHEHGRERVAYQARHAGVGIRVAESRFAARVDLRDHERGGVPAECAVGLGAFGRNGVGRGAQGGDARAEAALVSVGEIRFAGGLRSRFA